MANQIVITSGAKVRGLNGVLTGTSGIVSSVPLGAANGVATLDSGGKVPVSQLPSSVVTYLGTWNAATNTPTLVNGTGDAGDMYICNVAGTVNFGAGPITFAVGDWVLYGSGTWQKSNGQNGTVTSVAASITGDSIGITGSPIVSAGTLAFAFSGTNLQYVNGAGNLTTFPILTGYVTAVSGTAPVVSSGGTTPAISMAAATSSVDGYLLATDFAIFSAKQSALTFSSPLVNTSGTISIPAATTSVNGYLASADFTTFNNKQNTITLTTTGTSGAATLVGATLNIPNYAPDLSGYVTLAGTQTITGAKTFSGAVTLTSSVTTNNLTFANSGFFLTLQPPTLSVNRTVTLPNGTGTIALTSDISYPVTSVFGRTGAVVATSGDYTTAQVTESGNLYFTDARARLALSFAAGSGAYNSTTGVITIPTNNNQITNGAGYTTNLGTVTSIATTAPLTGGTITSSGTIGITQAGSTSSGYLSTGDWINFNTAFNSRITFASAPLSISSNTISISQATTSTNGYLSSTDWNTFNNKGTGTIGGSGTTNYLPKFTGTSTIGNSAVTDDGTTVTLISRALSGTSATFSTTLQTTGLLSRREASGSDGYIAYLTTGVQNTVMGFNNSGSTNAQGVLNNYSYFGNLNSYGLQFTTNGTVAMTINTSGNLGLGVTPSASNWATFELLGGNTITSYPSATIPALYFASNAYYNSGWIYKNSTNALMYAINANSGQFQWHTAPSGTAGNAISFTQAMTLTAAGNLGIGSTSPASKLSVGGDGYSGRAITAIANNGDFGVTIRQDHASGAGLQIFTSQTSWGNTPLTIATSSSTLFSISSNGTTTINSTTYVPFRINTTYGQVGLEFQLLGTGFGGVGSANNFTSDAGILPTDLGFGTNGSSTNRIVFATGAGYSTRMIVTAAGRLLLGTTTESTYLLDVNGTGRFTGGDSSNCTLKIQAYTYPMIDFISNDAASANNRNWRLAGVYNAYGTFEILSSTTQGGVPTTSRFSINGVTGAATFSSSVTATSFFESSSIKGKDIIATNPLLALDIDVIKYTRKSDESKDIRYGYSAEQIHSLMPELTDKDVTAVKYLDVHTILISQLQKEIKELKAKLN